MLVSSCLYSVYSFNIFQTIAADSSGGMWVMLFSLCGFDPSFVQIYKQIMALITAISGDFAAYIVSFIFTHIFCTVLFG